MHEQWSDYRSLQKRYHDQSKTLLEELRSLEERKNQIPLQNIVIRKGILDQLQVAEDQIPFVGELMKVKHSEKAWESAIERLLHNLGLVLLVPDTYYKQVNQYVNSTDLQGRIVYYRVRQDQVEQNLEEEIPNSLLSKLEINPHSEFHDWIEMHLKTFYDYVCTDNLEDFQRYEKALTKEGLIKHSFRHEKDDRPQVLSKSNYILGWDNREKMELIQAKRRELEKQIQHNLRQIKQTEAKRDKLSTTRDFLNTLLNFTYFSEIDWHKPVLRIQELNEETLQLKESSDQLKELETQLQHVREQIAAQQKTEEGLGEQKINLKRDIQDYQKQVADNRTFLQAFAHVNLDYYFPRLEAYLPTPPVFTLEIIDNLATTIRNDVYRTLEARRAERSKCELTMVRKMHSFKTPSEEIMQKYPSWTVDTIDLEDSPESIGEYYTLYERIKYEDLPRYEERFKNWLNERVIVNFASFEASLDNGHHILLRTLLQTADRGGGGPGQIGRCRTPLNSSVHVGLIVATDVDKIVISLRSSG